MSLGKTRSCLASGFGAWFVLAAALIAPIAAMGYVVVVAGSTRDHVAPEEDIVTAMASRESFIDSVDVDVALGWREPDTLAAPSWGGLVTEAPDLTAGPLISGARVAQIDDVWRIAAHTPRPFFGPVSSESGAAQVGMLNELLAGLGYPHTAGQSWGWDTTVGVRRLAAALQVPDAGSATAFDPSWVVWLPSESFAVAESELFAGVPAPAAGEPVVTGYAQLASAKVATKGGQVLPAGDPSGTWELVIGETRVPFETANLGSEALIAIGSSLQGQVPHTIGGVLQRHDPIDGWAVPAASVVTDSRGNLCVVVVEDSSSSSKYRPVSVGTLGGSVGIIRVVGELADDTEVVANPGRVMDDIQCS